MLKHTAWLKTEGGPFWMSIVKVQVHPQKTTENEKEAACLPRHRLLRTSRSPTMERKSVKLAASSGPHSVCDLRDPPQPAAALCCTALLRNNHFNIPAVRHRGLIVPVMQRKKKKKTPYHLKQPYCFYARARSHGERSSDTCR